MTDKHIRDYFASLGRKGGASRSPAKRSAVAANGKLGGRPKGSKNRQKRLQAAPGRPGRPKPPALPQKPATRPPSAQETQRP